MSKNIKRAEHKSNKSTRPRVAAKEINNVYDKSKNLGEGEVRD